MAQFSEAFLLQAIRNETLSRDTYAKLATKIHAGGRAVLERMSNEEDTHRLILSEKYRGIFGREPDVSAGVSTDEGTDASTDTRDTGPSPDFSFIEKSVFSKTDAVEALTLCLGAEIDAVYLYTKQMVEARSRADMKLLKSLVRFEKRHKKHLERLIKQAEKEE